MKEGMRELISHRQLSYSELLSFAWKIMLEQWKLLFSIGIIGFVALPLLIRSLWFLLASLFGLYIFYFGVVLAGVLFLCVEIYIALFIYLFCR